MRIRSLLVLAGLLWACGGAAAEEIRVAVASNFTRTAEAIARHFEEATHHKVILVSGATGKHYAQINNGAPFEVFLAADRHHPQMLEDGGLAVPASRFTYAVGQLILWSRDGAYVDSEGQVLARGGFRHLAIANPRLAPYGRAAQEVLEAQGLWGGLQGRMVRGENIGQTFQFVESGNAEVGFVALSQVRRPDQSMAPGSYWVVPQELYRPIEQQAVLLTDTGATRAFMEFLESPESRAIIRSSGYRTPREQE